MRIIITVIVIIIIIIIISIAIIISIIERIARTNSVRGASEGGAQRGRAADGVWHNNWYR